MPLHKLLRPDFAPLQLRRFPGGAEGCLTTGLQRVHRAESQRIILRHYREIYGVSLHPLNQGFYISGFNWDVLSKGGRAGIAGRNEERRL